MHKWSYAITAPAVVFLIILVAGLSGTSARAQDPLILQQDPQEDAGEESSPVERLSRWLRNLGKNPDGGDPAGPDASAILNQPQSEKSFDLLDYLEKKREAELSPSPFAAVRRNGSLRVEKKPSSDRADSHKALFTEFPAWTELPGHRSRRGSNRSPDGRKDSVRPPFDIYLWFLTGLPEKRIRFKAKQYRANHKK